MSSCYHLGGFDPSKPNGNLAEKADASTGTFTRWDPDGRVVEQRPLTVDEIAALTPPPQPLDPVGALATLLAVTGALSVEDAANAVGLAPNQLVEEAQAWAVAAQSSDTPLNTL